LKLKLNNLGKLGFSVGLTTIFVSSLSGFSPIELPEKGSFGLLYAIPDSTEKDSNDIELIYPFQDKSNEGLNEKESPLFLSDPSNVKKEFEYDPETGQYNYRQKMGERDFRNPTYMTLDEYLEYDMEKSQKDFWNQKGNAQTLNETEGFRPQINVKGELFDRIFGGNVIDIRPQGSAELSFGINTSKRENPILPERQRKTTVFDFNQKIQLNVIGNIGEKMRIQTNYNTEATFDFENQTKLEYTGYEDEIIQKIEAGNVALPLQSSLITGSQTLFGVKTELQFGRLRVTTVFSQEKGEKKEINVSGGAQVQEFEKSAAQYEENRHFFLSHLFREEYEKNLSSPPRITSRINITAVEVYITNTQAAFNNTRNVLGFIDLGNDRRVYNTNAVQVNAGARVADNGSNNLYANLTGGFPNAQQIRNFNNSDQVLQSQGLESGSDYERLENAILLSPNEYTLNPQLGYISLNRTLNPQDVLAVAYRYTYNGQVYQVGDLSVDGVDGQQALYLKLLKGTIINPSLPSWDLMMKNVYSLDAFNIGPNNFEFQIWYLNGETGVEIPYFPEGNKANTPLISVLGLDRISVVNDPQPDGVFDFIPNLTINPQNGKIYFPVLEPFGSYLRSQFADQSIANKYAFDSLYTTTQALAVQDVDRNRFSFKGRYESTSSSEISLNSFNIPEGSVNVTAGGAQLVENTDYTVDYNLGRVKILNEGVLASGQPIKVTLGSNSLFNIQTKTLMGSRFDYRVSEDINVGGTILNLTERPLTRKINIGDEPISNTIAGIDGSLRKEAPIITQLANFLPFYSSNAKSTVTVTAEAAKLFPGNSRAITKEGIAYIDDFEGSQTIFDVRSAFAWKLASTPQGQEDLFPEGNLNNNLAYGFNRANLAWYTIDPLFFRNDARTPNHIRNSPSQSNNFSREIIETEVFPNKDPEPGLINNLPTLDLAFYPNERGPYNYETVGSGFSSGLNRDGSLSNPQSRWGGIMREILSSDFEASNVEFIQFWIMDPFNEQDGNPNHDGGNLYFNIGSISEDILKDSRKSFENGLPIDDSDLNTETTAWGRVSTTQSVVNAFNNDPAVRAFQDVGLDGIDSDREEEFFSNYLDTLSAILDPSVLPNFIDDPSNDDYHYYRGSDYDQQELSILERYKRFNGHEGNSPTGEQSPEPYPTAATTIPDVEDINQNFNLDRTESYYQYRVELSPEMLQPENVGNNFITDVIRTSQRVNGELKEVNWYQFKIPIRQPEKRVGEIRDFKSIRFMRMFLKGFNEQVIVRFARLGFVRGEWRNFLGEEGSTGDTHGFEPGSTVFNIGAVNLEENANRVPINYTIPPDIDREIDFGTTNLRQLNEQSLSLEVCDLQDGFSKFAFRSMNLDVRQYGKLKMFAHAEAGDDGSVLNDNDVSVVIRLGTDFQNNYYEYEVPLAVTFPGQNLPDQVWPESNEIDLPFDRLVNVKQNRNRLSITPGNGVSITRTFEAQDGKNIIRVKGNPNLGEIRVIMIGVKNPKAGPGNLNDDGQPKCAEVWVNELRLSDFNNKGGWAATARMTAQIADLGSVNLSGTYSTPGWGSLEQKLNERQRETRQQYDLAASLDLAKLLPEGANVSIPMYYSVSESVIRPQFNPLDPDIELQELLSSNELTTEYKDSIRKITDDYTLRRSINFTNVRKLPGPNKTKQNFYDVENFSFTYAYSEIFNRSINIKTDRLKTYRGAINYNFTGKEKSVEPFKKVQFFQANKAFQLIQDINFNFVPSQVSIQNSFDRTYHERQARNITSGIGGGFVFESPPFHQKSFNWSRMYSLRHRFTKSLTFNFSANNRSLINEPQGQINPDDDTFFGEFNNEIWNNISRFGDNTNYNHNFDFSYNLPLNKIPVLDFINASSRYSATYSWDVIGNPRDSVSLGSRIQNSATLSLQGTVNMDMLYNKFQYVQDLKNPNIDNRYTYKEDIDKKKKKERKEKKKEEKRKKKEEKKKTGEASENEVEETNRDPKKESTKNTAQAKKVDEKLTNKREEEKEPDTTKQKKFFVKRYLMDNVIWSIMSVKTISANYSETQGTILPNYNQNSELLGMSNNFNAPGIDFVSGIQEEGETFLNRARDNEWLVDGIFVSGDFQKTYSKNYSIRATIRPIDGLRIQLTANKSVSENVSRFFFFDDDIDSLTGEFIGYNFDAPPIVSGNFSMSFLSFNTTFKDIDEKNFENETFTTFRENRAIISRRLQETNVNSRGFAQDSLGGEYADGFGSTSQQVLLYSFLSAYSGEEASRFSIANFTKLIPKPNWNITYDGLSKLPFFKKYFKSITLGHAYRSTFSVGSYTRNQVFGVDENNGDPNVRDNNNNFITERQLSNVSISESFSPLLNIDMTWNNSLITRVEFRRDRNISLAFANNQITEILGLEYIIGLGYRIADFVLPFRINNVQKSSDLDLRADISLRDNQTIIRRIVENRNELTAGQRIFSIKFTADYRFSRKLNFSFYYDRVANTPRISSSFPTANTTTGFRIRFSLAQ
tara:strand:+ start:36057 stop:43514 length:7458 start_codon:yes stop_codon:yes gene_type:complete